MATLKELFTDPQGIADGLRIFLVCGAVLVWALYVWTAVRTWLEAPIARVTWGRILRAISIGLYTAIAIDDLMSRLHKALSWRSPLFAVALIVMVAAWAATEKAYHAVIARRERR